ncbi:hypothetical protein F2P81_025199 [Scophthalmus maximus]|uniref:Uncharacterized protein n=1 Tax=Scophthalmus maximus TaxID=52904 RepID=A0A6A4RL40_SCOMX|nr:hypothetical protein F2P81_025199 [Scophthalmus maximus]
MEAETDQFLLQPGPTTLQSFATEELLTLRRHQRRSPAYESSEVVTVRSHDDAAPGTLPEIGPICPEVVRSEPVHLLSQVFGPVGQQLCGAVTLHQSSITNDNVTRPTQHRRSPLPGILASVR